MFTIINVTEDNGNLKSPPIRALKEALKAQTVDKIWAVAPGHVFYVVRGDSCLHTCSLYESLSSNVKQAPVNSPLINLIGVGSGYVIIVAEDGTVQVLKHSPEEGWLPAGRICLPEGDPIVRAALCQNRYFFWVRQGRGAHPAVSCALWRCIFSPEDCTVTSVCCLAVGLPVHSLYTFGTSVTVFPSAPDVTAIFWTFTEADTFSLSPISQPTQHLYSSTFELPLDAGFQYRRHLRLWRLQDRAAQVLDVLPSHLGTSLYIFVWDGTLTTLSILGPNPRTLQLETGLERPVASFTFGPVIVLVREKELTVYDVKTGKQMQHSEPVPGKLRKVLAVIGGFCTETGIHRLRLHQDAKDDRLPCVLQSEALQLCFSLPDCDVDKVSTAVRTKLHRILEPLVDCYQKLQVARDALLV
ncbi:uncharacterized protein LOC135396712 [Ornithodoros turicata]|uniref:uncharacterized protein LOC135396712 n=1 Tax=Ornithodoros turicata TaxID=34597 RepID=UPI003139EDC9